LPRIREASLDIDRHMSQEVDLLDHHGLARLEESGAPWLAPHLTAASV